MRPAEARDIGDAPHGQPVPVVRPRPARAGNQKYRAGCGATLLVTIRTALTPVRLSVGRFEVDVPPGEPSKWLTFYGTRALQPWDDAIPSS